MNVDEDSNVVEEVEDKKETVVDQRDRGKGKTASDVLLVDVPRFDYTNHNCFTLSLSTNQYVWFSGLVLSIPFSHSDRMGIIQKRRQGMQ